jgi:hypothetical protein
MKSRHGAVDISETSVMKQYLLTIYQPDGDAPAPEVLGKIMRDVHKVREELQSAGAWVFAGDLDAALEWARKLARATTLPIEVRPFHGNGDN